MIKFLLYILMKKKEEKELPQDLIDLLEKNNYITVKEWRDGNEQYIEDDIQDNSEREEGHSS
jgi:hypothetical protein